MIQECSAAAYQALLKELEQSFQPLPDKPEETPEGILRALWLTAANAPASVTLARETALPPLDEPATQRLRQLLDQRKSGVPLAYLTGRQNFLGLELLCNAGALIPRRETEILGRAALSKLSSLVRERGRALVVDACTGSGNLALACAHHEPNCVVYGSDLSAEAVTLARQNAEWTRLNGRVEFRQGDLLAPFDSPGFPGQVDLLTCNPPYISSGKVAEMPAEISAFEPSIAFDGGAFGIAILSRLISDAPRFLRAGSWLCFEVGLGQGPALQRQLKKNPAFDQVEALPDNNGAIRSLAARKARAEIQTAN